MNSHRSPRVTIIIVNYNSAGLVARTLDCLALQTFRDFKVIVVDNGSTDGSANSLADRPGVTVLRAGRNLGFAAGNNLGIASTSDCQWVVLLNPDAFPAPDWLERLVAATDAYPNFAFFGCRMRLADAPERLDGTGDVYHVSGTSWRRDHGRLLAQGVGISGEIFGPCAAAALYARAALEEVGGFDESYFCYHEDVDLSFRLRLRGHRCWYVADAEVFHVGSAITGKRSDFSVYHGHRNLVWTFVKNMPASLLWRYLPFHILANLAAIAMCACRGQLKVVLRAKWDALRALPRVIAERQRLQRARLVPARDLRAVMVHGIRPLLDRARVK